MIVDVHTHTPSHRDTVPDGERVMNDTWRPDRVIETTSTWAGHDSAQRDGGVDVSFVFDIATKTSGAAGIPADPARINDAPADLAAA